jgi:hypothetical protein
MANDDPPIVLAQVIGSRSSCAFVPPVTPKLKTLKPGDGLVAFGPAGNVSVRSTVSPFVMGSVPVFFTFTVHTTLSPAFTDEPDTVLLKARV